MTLLEQVMAFYATHTQEDVDRIWQEIKKEDHEGAPTIEEYRKFLKYVYTEDKSKVQR